MHSIHADSTNTERSTSRSTLVTWTYLQDRLIRSRFWRRHSSHELYRRLIRCWIFLSSGESLHPPHNWSAVTVSPFKMQFALSHGTKMLTIQQNEVQLWLVMERGRNIFIPDWFEDAFISTDTIEVYIAYTTNTTIVSVHPAITLTSQSVFLLFSQC